MIEKTEVIAEKEKHYIGEVVSVRVLNEIVTGEIVGIFPHFATINVGNYVRDVQWKDFVISDKL